MIKPEPEEHKKKLAEFEKLSNQLNEKYAFYQEKEKPYHGRIDALNERRHRIHEQMMNVKNSVKYQEERHSIINT
jgi:predicted  nucleic acid-binding Zn-ribbon protein